MAYGYIYKIINSNNNKVYIGQTTKTIQERFKEHLRNSTEKSKNTLHLYLAMNKYGKETFSVELLDTADNQEDLNEKECYWINYYNSIHEGYNMMQGGTTENPMTSAIVKQKHLQKMQSTEVRQKISTTMKTLRNTIGFSPQHKQRIKEARQQRKQNRQAAGLNFYNHPEHMASRSLPVYCILNTGERFDFESIIKAGKWWYETFRPFGDIYSTATYQRKILASIAGKEIKYGCKSHKKYKHITNIKWYSKESEVMPL